MVIIGLTTNRDTKGGSDCMPKDYVASVLRAGALPVILPMVPEDNEQYDSFIKKCLDMVDGLVFTGGPDIHPSYFGEELLPECDEVVSERDKADLTLMKMALDKGIPFLGICRGVQVFNVALGGTLYQDIPSQLSGTLSHSQTQNLHAHTVAVEKDSLLHQVTKKDSLVVTSRHHQSVKDPAPGLVVSARAEDGVIEAVEFENGYPAIGVQWHPENLTATDPAHMALFHWLVQEAEKRA